MGQTSTLFCNLLATQQGFPLHPALPLLSAFLIGPLPWVSAMLGGCRTPAKTNTHTLVAHSTHSPIFELILLPAIDCQLVSGVTILPRAISDHSPVSLHLGNSPGRTCTTWRMNDWFLQDAECIEALGKEQQHYWLTNPGLVPSQGMLWEAGKATIRGVARAWSTRSARLRPFALCSLRPVLHSWNQPNLLPMMLAPPDS